MTEVVICGTGSDGLECFDLSALACLLFCSDATAFAGDVVTVYDPTTGATASGEMPACSTTCAASGYPSPSQGVIPIPVGQVATITWDMASGNLDDEGLGYALTDTSTQEGIGGHLIALSGTCGGTDGDMGSFTTSAWTDPQNLVLYLEDKGSSACGFGGTCDYFIYSWDPSHVTFIDNGGGSYDIGWSDGVECSNPPQGPQSSPGGPTANPTGPPFDSDNSNAWVHVSVGTPAPA